MLRPLVIALALLLAAPLAAAAAPDTPCGRDPQAIATQGCAAGVRDPTGACSATGRQRSGVGYWNVRGTCAAGGASGSTGADGGGSPSGIMVNHTVRGQPSESGSLDRTSNGTFQCRLDGCAISGDEGGSGPAPVAYNTTPHWTVDTSAPTTALAWNGTVLAGDLDGDGAPDFVVSGGCDATGPASASGKPRPCGPDGQANATARHNTTGFFDITYRARNGTVAAADLDGDGIADLVVTGDGNGPQGIPANLTVQGVLRGQGIVVFADCHDAATTCFAQAGAPGGGLFAFTSPRGEGVFVFAGGAAHGCYVDPAAATGPKCF